MTSEPEEWVVVDQTAGPGLAEILCGLLESCGIVAYISQEGAWQAFPLTVGMLGSTQLKVKASDEERAKEVIEAYYNAEILPGEDSEQTPD
jgi:hypothetical protein